MLSLPKTSSDEELIERAIRNVLREWVNPKGLNATGNRDSGKANTFYDFPFFHLLDGGEDFQIELIPIAGKWTCPKGIYEIFVTLGDIMISVDHWVRLFHSIGGKQALLGAINEETMGVWHPLMQVFNSALITGWASRPAAAGYDADTIVYDKWQFTTASKGWVLSEGEYIDIWDRDITFYVRYRRIG